MFTRINWVHTLLGLAICTTAFFIFIFFIVPVFENIYNFFGRYFISERFGGGGQLENQGVVALALKAVFFTGVSAFGAFWLSSKLFPEAHEKSVVMVFSIVVIIWAGSLSYIAIAAGEVMLPIVIFVVSASPPVCVAYLKLQGEIL